MVGISEAAGYDTGVMPPFEQPATQTPEEARAPTLIAEEPTQSFEEQETYAHIPPRSGERVTEERTIDEMIKDLTPDDEEIAFVGQGGEHIVLELNPPQTPEEKQRHKRTVYKVNVHASLLKHRERNKERPNEEQFYDINDASKRKKIAALLEKDVEARRMQIRLLRNIFGFHAVPAEHSMVRGVPLTPELYNKLTPRYAPHTEKTPPLIPAMVTIQRRLELNPEKIIDITGGYAESEGAHERFEKKMNRERTEKEYQRAHELLVNGKRTEADPFTPQDQEHEKELKEICLLYPRLEGIMKMQEKDQGFREQLRNFARGLVKYAEDPSRPILDLVGGDNAIMEQREDGSWRLVLPDALFPDEGFTVEALGGIAERLTTEKRIKDPSDLSKAANIMQFIRLVNAFAIMTEIRGRAVVPESVKRVAGKTWGAEIDRFLRPVSSRRPKKPSTPEMEKPTIRPPAFSG